MKRGASNAWEGVYREEFKETAQHELVIAKCFRYRSG